MVDIKKNVFIADQNIRPYIRETALDFSINLSFQTKCQVFLKCENLQYTGSFKVRGALNKILNLTQAQREQGVVTASTGNHGAAVAFAAKKLNIKGLVVVPENVSPTKVDNIKNYDIPLKYHGENWLQTETFARDYAKEHNMIYISPYNDPTVIYGQGTIGLELTQQLNHIDVVLVPIGGGGLISGIAGFLKSVSPQTKIIGCMPENSPVMAKSIEAGKIIEMETAPTLSDATAGGIEHNSITFEMCQQWVDDYILVSEQEISQAIISLLKTQHLLVEGASGVALAALFKNQAHFHNKNVVVILSGANISLNTLKTIIST